MINETRVINYGIKIFSQHVRNGKVNALSLRDAIADHFGLSLEIFDRSDLLERIIAVCTVFYGIA